MWVLRAQEIGALALRDIPASTRTSFMFSGPAPGATLSPRQRAIVAAARRIKAALDGGDSVAATIEVWRERVRDTPIEDLVAISSVKDAPHPRPIRGALRYIETKAPAAGRRAGDAASARRSVYMHRCDLAAGGPLDLKSQQTEQQIILTATAVRGPGGRLLTVTED